MRRRVFYLDPDTESALRAQATAHGVSQGAIVRARIRGALPGGEPGTLAASADAWWDSRTPTRRVSIWLNHASPPTGRDDLPADQLAFFDGQDPA